MGQLLHWLKIRKYERISQQLLIISKNRSKKERGSKFYLTRELEIIKSLTNNSLDVGCMKNSLHNPSSRVRAFNYCIKVLCFFYVYLIYL